MHEQRRVRFANIDGISRADLPIAMEIWLDDLMRKDWPSRDTLKFANHLKRYMADPDPKDLLLRAIERHTQLDRKQVLDVLKQMQMFGAAEAFDIDGDIVRVSLTLSLMQRLRTLETKRRFHELGAQLALDPSATHHRKEGKWLPEQTAPDEEADDRSPHPEDSARAA